MSRTRKLSLRANDRRPRGITLLEVLISMFVLLVGLMGVAALIPAGRVELTKASNYDHSTMVGRAAFRELKARGYLNPDNWAVINGSALSKGVWKPNATLDKRFDFRPVMGTTGTPAVAIDPLGMLAPSSSVRDRFPFLPSSFPNPNLSLVRIAPVFTTSMPTQTDAYQIADFAFRSSDDLTTMPNSNANLPPVQRMIGTSNNTNPPARQGRRASAGNYSWLATIVADPLLNAVDNKVTVSVAVFYKRKLIDSPTGTGIASESRVQARLARPGVGAVKGVGGGDVVLGFGEDNSGDARDKFPRGVRAGQWIMMAGTVSGRQFFNWYRVAAADEMVTDADSVEGLKKNYQRVTLGGADIHANASSLTAYLFDGVVAVYEKSMRLEIP